MLVNPSSSVLRPKDSQLHLDQHPTQLKHIQGSPTYKLAHSDSSFYGSEVKALSEMPSLQSASSPDKYQFKVPSRSKNQSTVPVRKKHLSSLIESDVNNKTYSRIDYVPYTLKDYKTIKPKTYYLLGGLGPSNIGSEDWSKKKDLNEKRWNYGKDVYYSNAAKIPILPSNSPTEIKVFKDNSRARALDFAKSIIRPPLKVGLWPSRVE
jgi:hypothetical protein